MFTYKNGNYIVAISGEDGTKIRKTDADEFIPSFAENCDVKITDKCLQGCPFCYEGCTRGGKHGDLFKYKNLLDSLHPYTELALNGNDLDHPQLEEFLEFLKEKKVFANITVNQSQFHTNFEKLKRWQENKLIYGIGVSLISGKVSEGFIQNVKTLHNIVIHTIVGILTEEDINSLKNNGLKILLLGYKYRQRGVNFLEFHMKEIEKNKKYLYDNFNSLTQWFKVVSFDNLALDQLDVKSFLSPEVWNVFYMGDDGGYTFYIDLVAGKFSKNSISEDRYDIGDKTVDEMFKFIRNENTNS